MTVRYPHPLAAVSVAEQAFEGERHYHHQTDRSSAQQRFYAE